MNFKIDRVTNWLFEHKVTSVIFIAVILGPIGTAIYQLVIVPLLISSVNLILNLSTLGLDNLRDAIYADAGGSSAVNATEVFSKYNSYHMFFIVSVSMLMGVIIFKEFLSNSHDIKRAYLTLTFMFLFVQGLSIGILTKSFYSFNLGLHLDKLEILSDAVVSERIMRKFKAERVQIDNRTEYLLYENKLQSLISGHSFEPIDREFF